MMLLTMKIMAAMIMTMVFIITTVRSSMQDKYWLATVDLF